MTIYTLVSVMTSNEKPDSKILYGVDGSEAHLVAGHGLGDSCGSRDGVFSTMSAEVAGLNTILTSYQLLLQCCPF